MSADTTPISPTRFAEALKTLSLPTLHLKVLEIRNSILHLQFSNAQLKPYAEGSATTLDAADAAAGRPDPDCVEAIRENDVVIARMQERVDLIRAEVEDRGHSWDEFKSKEEVEAESGTGAGAGTAAVNGLGNARAEEERIAGAGSGVSETNGATAAPSQHPAWLDGTFQMGTIRNGEIHMDTPPAQRVNGTGGGRLTDEELRRAVEERLRDAEQDADDNGGMHL
ncbi:Translation machinery-associated protein 17 [Colletotrichum sidae]|uniref:Translation machinery-associated protein 17 n=2 Tax=Colletotrichum orbiculare species complex TaxID=2707354 RepID=A0A4R8RVD2_COLTR|nr:Translation machinery-associated protein 17 [Colletotrichum trifolii]TEA13825.1 Translation machinery-associated protein 17 [Colletotrichum sidae]